MYEEDTKIPKQIVFSCGQTPPPQPCILMFWSFHTGCRKLSAVCFWHNPPSHATQKLFMVQDWTNVFLLRAFLDSGPTRGTGFSQLSPEVTHHQQHLEACAHDVWRFPLFLSCWQQSIWFCLFLLLEDGQDHLSCTLFNLQTWRYLKLPLQEEKKGVNSICLLLLVGAPPPPPSGSLKTVLFLRDSGVGVWSCAEFKAS